MAITVQRANVILQIPDDGDSVKRYLEKGYNVIDNKTGEVIQYTTIDTVETLKRKLKSYEEEIKELHNVIDELQNVINELSEEDVVIEEDEKPKRQRKTKAE